MKTIELTQGYVALVDDKNFDKLNAFKWYAQEVKKDDGSILNVYAVRNIYLPNGKRTKQSMQRFIKGITDPKVQVDHFDHNGRNNLESNLRVATDAENSHNQRLHTNNVSGYKGVSWSEETKKWRASIKVDNHNKHLGLFIDILDAAEAYDIAAIKYFGRFSFTNAQMKKPVTNERTRRRSSNLS